MLDNEDITHVPAENRYVNTVFQSYALFPHMTVFENVAFGLRMQKTPAAEITPRVMGSPGGWCSWKPSAERNPTSSLVVNSNASPLLARWLTSLVCCCWMSRSQRWITDCKQMQNELKALQRKLGITFVFVTHDQEEALTMSDRIVVMRDGRIEQDGTPVKSTKSRKTCLLPASLAKSICLTPLSSNV